MNQSGKSVVVIIIALVLGLPAAMASSDPGGVPAGSQSPVMPSSCDVGGRGTANIQALSHLISVSEEQAGWLNADDLNVLLHNPAMLQVGGDDDLWEVTLSLLLLFGGIMAIGALAIA